MPDVQPLSDADEPVPCPKCGAMVPIEVVAEENPDDGTMRGIAQAHCKCGHWLTEDEIYA